jgi:hypothetical protein
VKLQETKETYLLPYGADVCDGRWRASLGDLVSDVHDRNGTVGLVVAVMGQAGYPTRATVLWTQWLDLNEAFNLGAVIHRQIVDIATHTFKLPC